MSEPFDDMMRRELGHDFGVAPDIEVELGNLCERYGLPMEDVMFVREYVMDILKPLANLRTFADSAEAEDVVLTGFRRDLEALIVRQITLLSQS